MVPPSNDDDFVYIPSSLDEGYLQSVLSCSIDGTASAGPCKCVNLCAGKHGGVSNSGATVLRISLGLSGGKPIDAVAKILSPCAVNIFKPDIRFSSRIREVRWAEWWGRQDVPWVPVVFDTRADLRSREFWIVQEYFSTVGWSDAPVTGMKAFVADPERLRSIFGHAADIHAHSRQHIEELLDLFPEDAAAITPIAKAKGVLEAISDGGFLDAIGVSADEREVIQQCCDAIGRIPKWVEEWDLVCVTGDIAPDNIGLRPNSSGEEAVTFDWGASELGPMEWEMFVLLGRLNSVAQEVRDELLQYYLSRYAELAGRVVPLEPFVARMPWLNFITHLGRIADCIETLRWVRFQTRTRDYLHLCVGLCERLLGELPFE